MKDITEKDAVRIAMNLRDKTQTDLARDAGLYGQAAINGYLNRNQSGIRFDILFKLLDTLEFDIYAVDRYNPEIKYRLISVKDENAKPKKHQPKLKKAEPKKATLTTEQEKRDAEVSALDLDDILNS